MSPCTCRASPKPVAVFITVELRAPRVLARSLQSDVIQTRQLPREVFSFTFVCKVAPRRHQRTRNAASSISSLPPFIFPSSAFYAPSFLPSVDRVSCCTISFPSLSCLDLPSFVLRSYILSPSLSFSRDRLLNSPLSIHHFGRLLHHILRVGRGLHGRRAPYKTF